MTSDRPGSQPPTSRPLILGSTSRYRHELLSRLKLPFEAVAPQVDETPRPGENPADLAVRLALAKARDVASRHPQAVVIGSDQAGATQPVVGRDEPQREFNIVEHRAQFIEQRRHGIHHRGGGQVELEQGEHRTPGAVERDHRAVHDPARHQRHGLGVGQPAGHLATVTDQVGEVVATDQPPRARKGGGGGQPVQRHHGVGPLGEDGARGVRHALPGQHIGQLGLGWGWGTKHGASPGWVPGAQAPGKDASLGHLAEWVCTVTNRSRAATQHGCPGGIVPDRSDGPEPVLVTAGRPGPRHSPGGSVSGVGSEAAVGGGAKHMRSPSQIWPHQHWPSSLMMQVPVPQQRGSSMGPRRARLRRGCRARTGWPRALLDLRLELGAQAQQKTGLGHHEQRPDDQAGDVVHEGRLAALEDVPHELDDPAHHEETQTHRSPRTGRQRCRGLCQPQAAQQQRAHHGAEAQVQAQVVERGSEH
eukprot:gene15869-33454_t